jgi:deazaflavin-dependent oxidoreductase (nitroreductase family)
MVSGGTVPTMGLATDLGYERGEQNFVQRGVVALVSTRFLSALARRILPSMDRLALRLSNGKSTVTSVSSGLPVLWLSTTGAKTKQIRTVPLLGFPVGNDLAVLGTHFGSQRTPGWVANLEADPRAEVGFRGRVTRVEARPALADEEAMVWDVAARAYPGYEQYADRTAHRVIRVFVLEAAGAD